MWITFFPPDKPITYTFALPNICNTEPPKNNKSRSTFAVLQQNLPGFRSLTCHVAPTEEWHAASISKTFLEWGPKCQATRSGMQIWKSIQLCLGFLVSGARYARLAHTYHQTCFLTLNKSLLHSGALVGFKSKDIPTTQYVQQLRNFFYICLHLFCCYPDQIILLPFPKMDLQLFNLKQPLQQTNCPDKLSCLWAVI